MAPPPPSTSQHNPPTPPGASPAEAPTGAAKAALEWVQDGMTLGLGTGRAASAFVEALGARVADGLQITGVPTSKATARLAEGLGIPLARLEDVGRLDITFDGADEVDPALNLIKGYGAAMVREKIVAASSEQLDFRSRSSPLERSSSDTSSRGSAWTRSCEPIHAAKPSPPITETGS